MTFDWHVLYPLHTVILDNSQVFGGVPCKAQLCNFSKWFFSPRFGVVPIWELWQFCYVRIGPPEFKAAKKTRVAAKEHIWGSPVMLLYMARKPAAWTTGRWSGWPSSCSSSSCESGKQTV